ncbi:MAG: class I SAM-dependent methyltransferase [Chroococcidiopsidaceae cyanobacterium CP_BM_RX_35]|nr:class I SAM-dependent methyltransferase [Chroococcidiopsidaceae cyanobacterium CP_BM_RX_35]
MANTHKKLDTANSLVAGAAIYNRFVLSVYDLVVLSFSNTFVWNCPSRQILDFYNEHVSERHLDVGVGTGYFLDKCRFPSSHPTIALADLNPNSLQVTAKRLRRYNPTTYLANVMEPLQIELAQGSRSFHRHCVESSGFDSIALNYLLHCLPNTVLSKGIVFRNLKPFLTDQGKVFGTTILGQDVRQNLIARKLTNLYNSKGIFGNTNDTVADLESILKDNFRDYSLRIVGCVALFVGQN